MDRKKKNEIRVRFAPSPTGNLHIGGARTALFNYLYAKKNKGRFILRIEDTDRERSTKEYEDNIMRSLEWLEINSDEGPFRQSEREEIYKKHIERLLEEGKAYYCFCTREHLEKMRNKQREKKEPPRYEGKCFSLTQKEKERLLKEKKNFSIRLKIPENEILEFDDLVRGKVKFNTKDIGGDFVIARDDFSALYNFVCAVDDMDMEITHVIRGEDHISNTPKQILIQRALGFLSPRYAHIAMLLGSDKSKLSKRHGAASVTEYKEKGYLREALINFIALLGWRPPGEREIFSLTELIETFSLKDCQRSGAVFDLQKLDYLNGYYIRNMKREDLVNACIPYLVKAGLIEAKFEEDRYPPAYGGVVPQASYYVPGKKEKISFQKLGEIISLYQERMKVLSEVGEFTDYFFKENIDYQKELLFWKDAKEEDTRKALEKAASILSKVENWKREEIEEKMIKEASKDKDKGKLLWPVRVALSGKKASAGPFDIMEVLGPETTFKRLKSAKNALKRAENQ